jgi:hypothetical protein
MLQTAPLQSGCRADGPQASSCRRFQAAILIAPVHSRPVLPSQKRTFTRFLHRLQNKTTWPLRGSSPSGPEPIHANPRSLYADRSILLPSRSWSRVQAQTQAYALSKTPISRSNVAESKSGRTSILRPPQSTTSINPKNARRFASVADQGVLLPVCPK